MDKMQEMEKLLRVLKKNRESVPLEDLKTKYKAAYEKLLEDIRQLGSEILQDQLEGLRIRSEDKDEILPKINQAIKDSNIYRETGRVLLAYDLDGFKEKVQQFRSLVMSVWEPYWQRLEQEEVIFE